ncbi:MAG: hypothetical protein HY255_04425 [Betaproteobacteria bacterium]|nr:hypothetical protein [Betaproteobacteria bacterium]
MNKTLIAVVAVVALLAYGAWNFFQVPAATSVQVNAATAGQKAVASSTGIGGGAPALIGMAKPSVGAARPVVAVVRSPNRIEFEKGRHLKQFYDRYMANPEGADAETKYLAAAAIEACQWRTRNQAPTEADKTRFLSRLKDNDPNNQQRIDAFTRIGEQCEGFQGSNLSAADASRLYREAAAAGDPAAKVAVAAEQFREQARTATGVEGRRLSEDQLGMIRDALASGDPMAMQRAGMLLTFGSTQLAERNLGPDGNPFNPRDMGPAWTMAACDRGVNCGPDNTRMLNGCAYQGQCGYQTLESYMQFNELAPNVYLAALQNQALINNAIAQGHWDWLGIAPGMGRTVTNPPAPTRPATKNGK